MCHRYGGKGHKAPTCRFKTTKCHNCGKIGHLERICRSKGKPINASGKSPSRPVHCVTESEQEQGEEYHLFNIGSGNGSPPAKVEVMVDNKPICMEIDTGVGPCHHWCLKLHLKSFSQIVISYLRLYDFAPILASP